MIFMAVRTKIIFCSPRNRTLIEKSVLSFRPEFLTRGSGRQDTDLRGVSRDPFGLRVGATSESERVNIMAVSTGSEFSPMVYTSFVSFVTFVTVSTEAYLGLLFFWVLPLAGPAENGFVRDTSMSISRCHASPHVRNESSLCNPQ